jgi:peptidoglycan/xylan/chitin deacetylase (PgdA/CDA1 family)
MPIIPILLYHSVTDQPADWIKSFAVSPDAFAAQLDVLGEEGATTLTVSAFVEALSGSPATLPKRPVLITFDDGFADFHGAALPILRERDMSSTLYVATDLVGRGDVVGHERGARMLDWDQLRDARGTGVEIGGHSHSHVQLDVVSRARAADEIARCKHLLEERLEAEVRSFAYPHGYHSARVRRQVIEAGYGSACAVKNAFSSTADDRFSLARLTVRAETTLSEIAAWASGAGASTAPPRERLRTRGWRAYRRARIALGVRPAVDLGS